VVAVRLLVPLTVPFRWSPFNLMRVTHDTAAELQAPRARDGRPALASHLLVQPARDGSREVHPALQAWSFPVRLAACGWAVGALALVAARIRAHRGLAARLRGPAACDVDPPTASLVAEVAAELGTGGVRALLTDLVEAPALYGIFHPRLLLPPGLPRRLSRPELRLIVLHELCHHRRRDLLSQALIHAAQTVHWFNPLVWLAGAVARDDCELACDEEVVRAIGPADPRAYGAILLKIVGMAQKPALAPLGVGIVETQNQIRRRIQMIASNRPPSLARSGIAWAVFVLIAGLGATREAPGQQLPAAAAAAPTVATTKAPSGWWKNGTDTSAYVVGVDPAQAHLGQPSAYVRSVATDPSGFCGMMQMCQAEKFLGKRLRLSAWMKTQNVDGGGAHLWFRVDGKDKNTTMLQFDNMDGRQVMGTTDWHQYSVVLDVPAEADALAFGFFLSGAGEAWVSGLTIEPVGPDVLSTNIEGKKAHVLPEAPVNLEFAK